jgi:hypothetical protein
MASPFQQQALYRKLIYTGLILGLFTVSLVYKHYLQSRANSLALREENRGEVELTGSALRWTLTGSRGAAVCFLWVQAMDKMKRNEWNELELIVDSVAKLQPHFTTPWLFQSWNMAFNVSVECDSPHDKYFYISRGIELLAEGERRNRGSKNPDGEFDYPGHPDLRFNIGFYYQLKLGTSDENRTLRSLFQLSCIEPSERDPALLEEKDPDGNVRVNLQKFERFCKLHPRLVRRLREQLNCVTPESVRDFLRDHKELPTRFDPDTKRLKADDQQFPILPPPFNYPQPQPKPKDPLDDDFDPFGAARAWYAFAMEPLPPLDPDFELEGFKFDRRRHRLPKMSHYIFRQYPALGQEFIATNLEEEGWFDQEGWVIKGRSGRTDWFRDDKGRDRPVRVGDDPVLGPRLASQRAWDLAFRMYDEFGRTTQLLMPDAKSDDPLKKRHRKLEKQARQFQKILGENPQTRPDQLSREMMEGFKAVQIIKNLEYYRHNTNFKNHYTKIEGERYRETVQGRKLYFEAENLWEHADAEGAMIKYSEWIKTWKDLLEKHPSYRENETVQEESYERQMKYLGRYRKTYDREIKKLLLDNAEAGVQATARFGAGIAGGLQALPWLYLKIEPSSQQPLAVEAGPALAVAGAPAALGLVSAFATVNGRYKERTLESLVMGDASDRIIRMARVKGPFDERMPHPALGASVIALGASAPGTAPLSATAALITGKGSKLEGKPFFNPEIAQRYWQTRQSETRTAPAGGAPGGVMQPDGRPQPAGAAGPR